MQSKRKAYKNQLSVFI